MKTRGKLKVFKQQQGYGFIQVDGRSDVFCHCRELKNSGVTPDQILALQIGTMLDFDIEQGDRGPRAVNITLA